MSRRILIVDDEQIVALDLQEILVNLGYTVIGLATTAEEAIQLAEEKNPELVLMDIRLYGAIDGIEASNIIRAKNKIPVIFLSAFADDPTLKRALETSPAGYLTKPFTQQSLKTTIEVALHKDESERISRDMRDTERRRLEKYANELKDLTERLKNEASTDPLTQLYNRRHLDLILNERIEIAKKTNSNLGFIILDLDFFKQINDNYGHMIGDALLQSVSDYLRNSLRINDTACRYGGDEIAIVVPNTTLSDTVAIAERFRMGIEKLPIITATRIGIEKLPTKPAPDFIKVTASFGVAAYPEHGLSADNLIAAADSALYKAKVFGRNCVLSATI